MAIEVTKAGPAHEAGCMNPPLLTDGQTGWTGERRPESVEHCLTVISSWMRDTGDGIKARWGTESNQWYAYLIAAEHMSALVDTVPGLRATIIEEM